MAISKKRQKEILRLADEGGDDLTDEISDDEKLFAQYRSKIRKEMLHFLRTTSEKKELHFFAQNWNWDGDVVPLFTLIKNPHCDAGTLLFLYWYGCPEDFYLFHKFASEIDGPCERDIYRLLRQIERKIVKSEYDSASIPFDPTNRISMWDQRDEFARSIPDIMYQPITGRKKRGG